MKIILLDTTVASYLHPKKKNDALRKLYEKHMQGKILALSFQSVGELWEWAISNNWSRDSKVKLEAFLGKFLVIPYDFGLAKCWAEVMFHSKLEGRRFEAGDCWIAATAVHRNPQLLTHDRDFSNRKIPGLEVVSYVDEKE
jgi:tRNA(fMet)-specific endonuclease VapC